MEFKFGIRHHNRKLFPTKHIVVCEDNLINQLHFAAYLSSLYEAEGLVQIDYMCSAVAAALIMSHKTVDLLILDHDMPYGFGSELIEWMHKNQIKTPIITASGWPPNNDYMDAQCKQLGMEHYKFLKMDVFQGKATDLIKKLVNV